MRAVVTILVSVFVVACAQRPAPSIEAIESRLTEVEARLDALARAGSDSSSLRVADVNAQREANISSKTKPLHDAAEVIRQIEMLARLGYTDQNSADVRELRMKLRELLDAAAAANSPAKR